MTSKAKTVEEYLLELPDDRRSPIQRVRDVIVKNLPEGMEECMQYGMISYVVPHSRYPAGYHCDPSQPLVYASLASQKHYMVVYLASIYGDPNLFAWFAARYKATGKKMNLGKSCVRFKKLDDLPLDLVGEAIAKVSLNDYVVRYEAARSMQKAAKSE